MLSLASTLTISRKCVFSTVFNEQNQILLLLRNDCPAWELIGGVVEKNESFEESLVREAIEEIGIEIRPTVFLGDLYREITDRPLPGYRHYRYYHSILNAEEIENIVLDEHVAYGWFDIDKIPINMAPLHRMAATQSFQGPFDPSEQITLSIDDLARLDQLNINDFYALDLWRDSPKVQEKRAKGQMRFDPFPEKK